jgi:hypothetical protein
MKNLLVLFFLFALNPSACTDPESIQDVSAPAPAPALAREFLYFDCTTNTMDLIREQRIETFGPVATAKMLKEEIGGTLDVTKKRLLILNKNNYLASEEVNKEARSRVYVEHGSSGANEFIYEMTRWDELYVSYDGASAIRAAANLARALANLGGGNNDINDIYDHYRLDRTTLITEQQETNGWRWESKGKCKIISEASGKILQEEYKSDIAKQDLRELKEKEAARGDRKI